MPERFVAKGPVASFRSSQDRAVPLLMTVILTKGAIRGKENLDYPRHQTFGDELPSTWTWFSFIFFPSRRGRPKPPEGPSGKANSWNQRHFGAGPSIIDRKEQAQV